MPCIRNPIHRRSTFPGCLTPGVLSAVIPSGCLTPEVLSSAILPGCLASRIQSIDDPPSRSVSHPESSPPSFHPGASPGILSTVIPPGCLTPEIPLLRHSTRMSCIRNPIHRRSTFPGCLTPGTLSADVPPSPDISHPGFYLADDPSFSSSLEHFP